MTRTIPRGFLYKNQLPIARLVIAGETSKQIADRLGLTLISVKDSLTRIYAKCGLTDSVKNRRATLVSLFLNAKLPPKIQAQLSGMTSVAGKELDDRGLPFSTESLACPACGRGFK